MRVALAAVLLVGQCAPAPATNRVAVIGGGCPVPMTMEAPFGHEVASGLNVGDCVDLPDAIANVRLCCPAPPYRCGPRAMPLLVPPTCNRVVMP